LAANYQATLLYLSWASHASSIVSLRISHNLSGCP